MKLDFKEISVAWFNKLIHSNELKKLADDRFNICLECPSKKEIFKGKLKKDNSDITLQLTPTIDILKEIGLSKNKIFKVGFAAESENLIENAQKKLKEKNLDLIVANLIHESMGLEDTKISIIDKNNVIEMPKSNKIVAAKAILKEIAHRIHSDK